MSKCYEIHYQIIFSQSFYILIIPKMPWPTIVFDHDIYIYIENLCHISNSPFISTSKTRRTQIHETDQPHPPQTLFRTSTRRFTLFGSIANYIQSLNFLQHKQQQHNLVGWPTSSTTNFFLWTFKQHRTFPPIHMASTNNRTAAINPNYRPKRSLRYADEISIFRCSKVRMTNKPSLPQRPVCFRTRENTLTKK